MDDFFLASDRSITVELKFNKVTVTQFKMHNFDQWSGHARAVKEFLKNYPDDIERLLLDKNTETLELVGFSIGHNVRDIERIMLQERENSFDLIKAVLVVNDVFFSEREPKHDDSIDPRKKSTWFDTFQLLISHGHTNREIMQMTYGAFRHYLKAAQKIERRKILNNAFSFRGGAIPSKRGFENFQKNLEK